MLREATASAEVGKSMKKPMERLSKVIPTVALVAATASAVSAQESASDSLLPILKGGKWGYVDRSGSLVIPPQFDHADRFAGGVALVSQGSKWGYVDVHGRIVAEPHFDSALGFSEGVAAVEAHGKWGFLDKADKFVVEPEYVNAGSMREGLAPVSVNVKALRVWRLMGSGATSTRQEESLLRRSSVRQGHSRMERPPSVRAECRTTNGVT